MIVFDVLKECKYAMILKLSWLQKINFWIDWINHELYFINEAYKVIDQSEICLSKHELWNHKITFLSEKMSMWKSLYNMSENQLWEIWEYINKNLKQKFIKSLKSSAKYSILFVSKLNNKKWLWVDYRHLNNIMTQDNYSLFLIKELQKHLKDTKWFMKLNLHEVYYWIQIKEDDEWKTVFQIRYKHFEYTVMSFGLKNASVIFQQLINNMMQKYLDIFVIMYLNDILIYFNTFKKHHKHIWKILKKLNEQILYVNKKKSWFETQKINFLKYVIQSDKIVQNSQKTKTVMN